MNESIPIIVVAGGPQWAYLLIICLCLGVVAAVLAWNVIDWLNDR